MEDEDAGTAMTVASAFDSTDAAITLAAQVKQASYTAHVHSVPTADAVEKDTTENTATTTTSTTSTDAIWSRLHYLYVTAHHYAYHQPTLSTHLINLMRIHAIQNGITLDRSLTSTWCPYCNSIFLPTINCHVRVKHDIKTLRNLSARKRRKRGKDDTTPPIPAKLDPKRPVNAVVYHCLTCSRDTVLPGTLASTRAEQHIGAVHQQRESNQQHQQQQTRKQQLATIARTSVVQPLAVQPARVNLNVAAASASTSSSASPTSTDTSSMFFAFQCSDLNTARQAAVPEPLRSKQTTATTSTTTTPPPPATKHKSQPHSFTKAGAVSASITTPPTSLSAATTNRTPASATASASRNNRQTSSNTPNKPFSFSGLVTPPSTSNAPRAPSSATSQPASLSSLNAINAKKRKSDAVTPSTSTATPTGAGSANKKSKGGNTPSSSSTPPPKAMSSLYNLLQSFK